MEALKCSDRGPSGSTIAKDTVGGGPQVDAKTTPEVVIMLRRLSQGMLGLTLLVLLNAVPQAGAEEDKPNLTTEKAREALVKFDKNWKDYANEPNFGDPRWKLKMETLVKLAKAGRTAIPLLEPAAKEGSPWAPHTRELAVYVLGVCRDIPAVCAAWANYDLSQIDVAKVGKQAPDFALADAAGHNYRLGEYRGEKTMVVTFILQDI
jgi:hypothetical protein